MTFKQFINRKGKMTFKRIRSTKEMNVTNESVATEIPSICSSSSSSDNSSSEWEKETSDSCFKTVRFVLRTEQQEAPASSYFFEDEVPQLWSTHAERRDCIDEAKRSGKQSKSAHRAYVTGLEASYRNARFIASTMDATEVQHLLSDSVALSKHWKDLHNAATVMSDVSLRGLEEVLSETYDHAREDIIEDTRSLVVCMNQCRGTTDLSNETAREYSEVSRTSAVFARLIAEADAAAIANLF